MSKRSRFAVRFILSMVCVAILMLFSGNVFFQPPSISGYTEVNTNVGENGEARLQIPIAVPKGTILTPEISIGYNSQAGNGLLGQGFQLEGLYTINRVAANKSQDNGLIDGVDFDANDRFAFNGERLVKISGGTYGGDGTQYETEQRSFSKYVSYGTAGSGPQRFKVWTKSGLIMDFGNTADSRIEAQGRPDVLIWLVNRIADTKGNYIDFTYIEDNTNGEYRIDKIQYTGNAGAGLAPYNVIQFNYEDRTDTVTTYIAGSRMKTAKRLFEIVVTDNGNQYRRYEIEYIPNTTPLAMNVRRTSRISQITEVGSNGTSFQPTTFDWTIENTFATIETPPATNKYSAFQGMPDRIKSMDVTGDGREDLVLGPDNTAGANSGKFYIMRSEGNNFVDMGTWLTDATWNAYDQRLIRPSDVNADGLSDMIVGPSPTGTWWALVSNGASFAKSIWAQNILGGFNTAPDRIWAFDATGDGRQDVVAGPDASGNWHVLRSTGSSFVDSTWATGMYGSWAGSANRIRPMEVTGDGLTDIVIGPDNTGKWFVIRNTGAGFVNEGQWITGAFGSWETQTERIRPADVNSDGLQDIILGPEAGTGNWYVIQSKGNAFVTSPGNPWITGAFAAWTHQDSIGRIRQADLNGDGLSDFLIGPRKGDGHWFTLTCTGKSFVTDTLPWLTDTDPAAPVYLKDWTTTAQTNLTRPADFTGDGLPDLIFGPTAAGNWYRVSNQTSEDYPNLLRAFTSGHGARTEFVYDRLTNPNTYTKGIGAVYPKMNFIGPLYVVKTVRSDNGIGGQNRVDYKYHDVKLDLAGRGFRGFGKTEQIDSIHGTKTIVFFERQHEYLSTKISATEQRLLANNKLLYEAQNTLDTFEYFGKTVHFSFTTSTLEKWYEPNDAGTTPYKTKTTNYNYESIWGNATLLTEDYNNGLYIVQTNSTYTQDTSGGKWILGRLTEASVTKTLQGQAPKSKSSTFAYDPASGILTQEVLNSTSTTLKLQKDYTLDVFGNRLTETVSGPGITTRTTIFTYDAKGRNLTKTKNPLNQEVTYTYEFGLLKKTTDPNGLEETTNRDGFGRPVVVFHPDGTTTNTTYYLCDSSNYVPRAVYYIEQVKQGGASMRTYFDVLDREIRKQDRGLDGQLFYADTEYDSLGLVARKSDPYRDTALWNTIRYDVVQRMVSQTAPGNRRDSVVYNGLTTTFFNAQNQKSTRITNVMGWPTQAKDDSNNAITYGYDSEGNTTTMTDPAGNVWTMTYDSRGNKTSITDPDLGYNTYTYNTLGLLTSQNYPNGNTISLTYDLLDRKLTQTEPERTLDYEYDTQSNGIGKLARVKINSVTSQEFTFDVYGRVLTEKNVIEAVNYTTTFGYDSDGRMNTLTYPASGFKLRYVYDAYGHAKQVENFNTGYAYWRVDSLNNRGQTAKYTLGNGLSTRMGYDELTGYLESIRTGNAGNPIITQNLAFTFSPIGNLTQRQDIKISRTENFTYDNLNRLTQSQVSGQTAVNIGYNAIGNILSKSDVGTYTYGQNGAGPHMVTSIDHSGVPNCFYGFQGSVAYTSYNYPKLIVDGTDSIALTYDAGRMKETQRLVKNGAQVWRKHYVNEVMERVTQGSYQKYVHHIKIGSETIATLTRPVSGGNDTLRYLHKDHLGSLQAISKEDGSLSTTYSYDAWGKPRDPATWQPYFTPAPLPPFERGFTFHEMMGIEDLVHMNARLYDPAIGRVLSPDPFIQAPDNLQSLNRASYVLNNPLSYTDPTGFWSIKKAFKSVTNFVKENISTIATIAIAIALAPASGGASLTLLGTIASGAAAGFGGAFIGTIANGGDLGDALRNGLKGGAIGALSAGLTYGVGSYFGEVSNQFDIQSIVNEAGRATAHGVVQGGISELSGGDFKSGFLAGVGSSLAGSYLHNRFETKAGRVASGAVVGGTISSLTGGKFANGAVAGAFVQLFNDGQHQEKRDDANIREYDPKVSYCSVVGDFFNVANEACYNHDLRYSIFGYIKQQADDQLHADIIANNPESNQFFVHAIADIYYAGVRVFGQPFYDNAQHTARLSLQ